MAGPFSRLLVIQTVVEESSHQIDEDPSAQLGMTTVFPTYPDQLVKLELAVVALASNDTALHPVEEFGQVGAG